MPGGGRRRSYKYCESLACALYWVVMSGSAAIGPRERAFDLHLHTHRSLDAFTSTDDLLRVAKAKGIGIAVTDHSEIRGAVEALERSDGVEVIPAIEVKARSGVDIMVYFERADDMVDYYRKVIEPRRQGIHSFIPALREREIVDGAKPYACLLSAPHPYAPDRMGLAGVADSGAVGKDLLERMDLIETENAMMPPRTNRRAVALAEQLRKPMIGGSDAHVPWMVGSALTVIPKDEPFFAALRAGRCRAVGGSAWHLASPAVFLAGQAKFLTLPGGWTLLKHNLAVFHDRSLRDGSKPEHA